MSALTEKIVERRQGEETQVQRRYLEELKSSASDEGVIMKGSSAEELEEKEYVAVQRRDSEE